MLIQKRLCLYTSTPDLSAEGKGKQKIPLEQRTRRTPGHKEECERSEMEPRMLSAGQRWLLEETRSIGEAIGNGPSTCCERTKVIVSSRHATFVKLWIGREAPLFYPIQDSQGAKEASGKSNKWTCRSTAVLLMDSKQKHALT